MKKVINTKEKALNYLQSLNIGYHKGYTLKINGRMYPIELDDTADLIRWCEEDRRNDEEAQKDY